VTVRRSGEHIVQIVHRRVFNCYLVREDDGLTLVDTGPAGALPAIRAELHGLGVPLRRVLLTHTHADHLGGLDELADMFGPELEVIVGRREAALLDGDFTLREGEPSPSPNPRNPRPPTDSSDPAGGRPGAGRLAEGDHHPGTHTRTPVGH
jgi:glyoxylase-like metal-dependent hydrolase (beta-lactamase superfamily II)